MATTITSECINCGACEPECPNTAIYAGGVPWDFNGAKNPALTNDIFYIVPQKCTECVGFHDHEACAAVCPVDCCVPDPNNPETEQVLIERARELHPDKTFDADFPSRFKKAGGEAAAVSANGATAAAKPAAAPAAAAAVQVTASAPAYDASEFDPATWSVPLICHHCNNRYAIPYRHFQAGVVFYCPNCSGSFVPTIAIYNEVKATFEGFYGRRQREREALERRRARETAAFEAKSEAERRAFERQLESMAERIKPAGKMVRPKGLAAMFS